MPKASFLTLLRRALSHYERGDLLPGPALERALLRLYAAHARAEERYRLVGSLLGLLTRIAPALELAGDAELADALATCIMLRGTVPDRLLLVPGDAYRLHYQAALFQPGHDGTGEPAHVGIRLHNHERAFLHY